MENLVLNTLNKKRNKWVLANQENDFEEGINNLLTELYPDNAHFIYELLQNAEDAGAKKVSFNLQKDKVIFVHNGVKLFDEKDVTAITKIGKGTKRDDINKIGKFGVGFKAVFSYTDSPRIFSGNYNFEINNLVVPNEIDPVSKDKDETVFHFPFNSISKPKEAAYSEVKKGLLYLNPTTLLFLSSIQQIEIYLEGESYYIQKKEEENDPFVIITDSFKNEFFTYLKFKKNLPNNENLYVSIAFKLEKDSKTGKEKISINEKGEVAIFFPAEKETSNLKFHIHAPFASTVARDSIKDRAENTQLVELISELLCEATSWVKKNNLLDFDYIKCLPIADDNLSEFYEPIRSKIIAFFNDESNLLCDDGEYHPASMCYRSSKRIKDVIDIPTLKILKGINDNHQIFWLKNPTQRNSREDKFIQSLNVIEIEDEVILKRFLTLVDDYENEKIDIVDSINEVIDEYEYWDKKLTQKLKSIIEGNSDNHEIIVDELYEIIKNEKEYDEDYLEEIRNITEQYIEFSKHQLKRLLDNKSNQQIKNIYELLYDLIEKKKNEFFGYYQRNTYGNLKIIIKLSDGSFNYENKDCYFPSKTEYNSTIHCIVNEEVFEEEQDSKNQKSKQFLEFIGVKEISLETEVDFIINEFYRKNASVSIPDNLKHILLFLKYYKEQINQNIFDKSIFRKWPILINTQKNLVIPDQILIDEPWESTKLQILTGDNDRYLLYELYFEMFNQKSLREEKKLLLSFFKDIGCNFDFPIEETTAHNHPNWHKFKEKYANETGYCVDIDFNICSDSASRLKAKDIDVSLLAWKKLSSVDERLFEARYRANYHSSMKTDLSSLMYTLMNITWIPDKNGVFHKPKDISKEELHDKFKYNDDNGWLTKIGFGRNKLYDDEKYKDTNEIIENETGVPLELIKEFFNYEGLTKDEIIERINKRKAEKSLSSDSPDLLNSIKKHTKNISPQKTRIDPNVIIDEEQYKKKAQEQLDKQIAKSKRNFTRHNFTQKIKIGKQETREFLKQQYHGYCQICGFTFDLNENKGKYFEVFDWMSEKISNQKTNIIDAGSSVCLCSRCHSILKYGDFEVKSIGDTENIEESNYNEFANKFNLTITDSEVPDVFSFIEMDMFTVPIRLLNQDSNIYYSEEHFLHFYNMLTLKDDIKIKDFIDEDNTTRSEIIDHSYSAEDAKSEDVVPQDSYNSNISFKDNNETNEQTKISKNENIEEQVKSGDTVYVKYLNSDQELELKLVDYQPNLRSKNGINEISSSSPFGKKVIGKSVGTVFNLGVNQIKILDIVR